VLDPLPWVRRHGVLLTLAATVAAAALARFVRLDLMEFKFDEAEACRLALHVLGRREPGVGPFFPTTGLSASVGLAAPPLFAYVLALPLAIARTPLAAAGFVATTNIAAVWLCFVAARRWFSTFVGVASATMFALSPWAIIYSRKIWPQDLLPICTVLFLLALHGLVVEKRPRSVLWLLLLVGAATQLHLSACVLALVLVAAIGMARDAVRWRWMALGIAGVLLLYAPYIWHVMVVGHVREAAATTVHPDLLHRFLKSGRDTLAVGAVDRIDFLLGSQSAVALPLSIVFGTTAFLGLLASCRGRPLSPTVRARMLLPMWFVLPLLALTLLPIMPYPHYFIVLYPLPFLGVAVALEALARWRGGLAWVALAGCLGAFAVFDARSFNTVRHNGGAAADYGVAYRYKADAVSSFLRDNPHRHFDLEPDPHGGPASLSEFRLLSWIERHHSGQLGPAAVRYVLAERFDERSPARERHTERFGPLSVTVVPLPRARR
jgi:Dolichyl-phosphate-mannose-protein mannosyltransferase